MNDVQIIKQSVQISDVLKSEWYKLYPDGADKYKLQCCSRDHEDNTPSLSIDDQRCIFRCWWCWIGWDIINILEYIRPDLNSFKERLSYLQNNYLWKEINNSFFLSGPRKENINIQNDSDMIEIMNYIAIYWAWELPNNIKDNYLSSTNNIQYRGINGTIINMNWYWLTPEIITEYKLWYSQNSKSLYKILIEKFDIELIEKTQLFDNRWMPLFKNRITIPYFLDGNCIYFTARQTEFTPVTKYETAKYKDQPIHNKHLYNQDDLLSDCIFITEWPFDSLALKNIWYHSVALWWLQSNNQIKETLIKWLENNMMTYILFDSEINKSWEKEALKLQSELKRRGISSNIITLPLKKNETKIDINTYLWKHSKDEFNSLLTF